jgi:phosphatidylinositol alpha-1,6-mannosyltransferase
VSRLVPKNALDDLIRAMPAIQESHPNTALLLVGEGGERCRLESMASELGIRENVRFAGSVEHREIARYLQLSDVFVRPSRSEGLGSAFLEAMACGVPVVGTPVGGIVDFLRDGENGLFCEPNRPETIADTVLRLLNDADLAKRLSHTGRRLVERDYTWDRVAERIGGIYEELLEE